MQIARAGQKRQLARQSGARNNWRDNLAHATTGATVWHNQQLARKSGTVLKQTNVAFRITSQYGVETPF